MVQQRQTKTEGRIREALTRLLPKKGVEGISVSDIAREAGINRGTFYAHYVDKYDLMEKQIEAIATDLTHIVLDSQDDGELVPYRGVLQALHYVRDNYAFLAAITSNGTNVQMREHVKDLIRDLLEESARRRGLSLSFGGIPQDYGREMVLSSTTSVLWLWLAKGCKEPPEEIADIIWKGKGSSPEELLA